jgi:cytoskeleton protein RodZ
LISGQDADTLATMSLPARPTANEFGAAALAARTAAGVSLQSISERTKISQRTLAAIEAGEFAKLPDRTFSRLFVKQYAELIGERPEPWQLAFDAAWDRFINDSQTHVVVEALPSRPRRLGPWLVGAALVTAALALLLLVERRQRQEQAAALSPTPTALLDLLAPTPPPTVPPAGAETAAAPAVDAGALLIKTHAGECWVEVRVAGEPPVSRLLAPESEWQVAAAGRDVQVLVGNAGVVGVTYFGKTFDPVGKAGVVARLRIGSEVQPVEILGPR